MKHVALAALAAAALTGAAFAQTVAPAGAAVGLGLDDAGFYTYAQGQQLLGSRLIGADVWGAEGESIGEVDDLLLDPTGDVVAIVVNVGGFLGLGAHSVAISTDNLEFVMAVDAVVVPADGTAAVVGDAEDVAWGWTGGQLERVQVNYTREQLEAAPEFEYAD